MELNKNHHFEKDTKFEIDESKCALICPMTGVIMQKFRIDAETEHKLNYSHVVGAVWLDKGEWSMLKEMGYAGSLNKVFTLHWQKMIRENKTHAKFAKLYRTKFGHMDYERVRLFRHWLEHHPKKSELIAYLNASDPYSAER
jgi:Zn-finger nucleic acid-binding protein